MIIFAATKRLPLVILLVWVLVAVVMGCNGAHRYDARLVAADSLMQPAPDSALAIVEAINLDSLPDEGNRAYRDLLLTQSRYRCYITATSDSDINRALNYYRAHSGEHEKLTRAYIYKGAVMEELGHPDSAMLYYKHAEATAASDDYFNLGYTKIRMGSLYNEYYSMDGKEIGKYEEALHCFRHTKDSMYLIICLNNLGCQYRESNPDKAESLLLEASKLAKQLNDTNYMIMNTQALIVLYRYCHRYDEAHQLIQDVTALGVTNLDYNLYLTAAFVYARLGITDTAESFLNLAQKYRCGDDAVYEMYYHRCLSDLALLKQDTITYLRFSNTSEHIADSLKSNKEKLDILKIDERFDQEQKRQTQFIHDKKTSSYLWLIILVASVLVLFIVFYYRKVHHFDSLISDLKKESQSQADSMRTLQHNIDKLRISDDGLKESIDSHMALLQEVIEACYHAPRNVLAEKIQKLLKFQESNKDVWTNLYHYIDNENNGIMSRTMQSFPQLDDKELLMIALTCMGYSCAQIAIVLDYSNATSISTIRKRIATKMQLDCSLGDYIMNFKPNH